LLSEKECGSFERQWRDTASIMATRQPIPPSPKLLALQRDFQQIATMAGYANASLDPPQLRLFFTMYGRITVKDADEGLALTPRLQAWCDGICLNLREDSSSAIMPPQVQISAPQLLPNGESWYLVATITFGTKVTESSYQRVRNAVLAAYQSAAHMREKGLPSEGTVIPAATPEPQDASIQSEG
jgi:hypothetical protein